MAEQLIKSEKYYFGLVGSARIFRSPNGEEKIDLSNQQKTACEKAEQRKDEINDERRAEYQKALTAWYVEHDRLMEEILGMWEEIRTMEIQVIIKLEGRQR
jgi:hypothetical protein